MVKGSSLLRLLMVIFSVFACLYTASRWGQHLWPQVYKKMESPHYLYSPCEKLHNYALF
jgi:hypothetical protein